MGASGFCVSLFRKPPQPQRGQGEPPRRARSHVGASSFAGAKSHKDVAPIEAASVPCCRLPSPSPAASELPMASKRDDGCQSRAMAKRRRPPPSTAHRPLPREPQANHFLEPNTPGVKRVARGGGAPYLRDACAPLRAHSDSCEGRIFGGLGRSPELWEVARRWFFEPNRPPRGTRIRKDK
jgi:hypothetical protein